MLFSNNGFITLSSEIIEVLIKPGDVINKNDPIVTLESDKSSVEVPSPFSGKITELKVKIGDNVNIIESKPYSKLKRWKVITK